MLWEQEEEEDDEVTHRYLLSLNNFCNVVEKESVLFKIDFATQQAYNSIKDTNQT